MNKLKRLSLTQKIAGIVVLAWVVGAGTSVSLIFRLKAASRDYDNIFKVEVQQQAGTRVMQVTFKKQVQEWKDTLLRGSAPDALQKYSGQFLQREQEVHNQAAALKQTAVDPQVLRLLDEFLRAHEAMGVSYRTALSAFTRAHGKNPGVADAMVKGQDRAPTDLLDNAVDMQSRRVTRLMSEQSDSVSRQIWWVSALLALSLLATGALAFFAVRRIDQGFQLTVRELLQGTDQIASAAGQVSTASQSLAQSASEQAAAIEETSASSRQMAAVTQQNADNSRTSAQLMVMVAKAIQAANGNLTEMESSMEHIDASSQKIRQIVKIIEEIAFQTNLLALNAAVEAARAGEAGKGFAVVADEVRNLASRCAGATNDTNELIEESISRTTEGKQRLEHLAGAIRTITGDAAKVQSIISEIDSVSQEQARGVQQVSSALVQMSQVTQQAAASSEECAAAAEQLNGQAESMRQSVWRLNGGSSNPAESGGDTLETWPRRPTQSRQSRSR